VSSLSPQVNTLRTATRPGTVRPSALFVRRTDPYRRADATTGRSAPDPPRTVVA